MLASKQLKLALDNLCQSANIVNGSELFWGVCGFRAYVTSSSKNNYDSNISHLLEKYSVNCCESLMMIILAKYSWVEIETTE